MKRPKNSDCPAVWVGKLPIRRSPKQVTARLRIGSDRLVVRLRDMPHHKSTLPTKICISCQRPFAWRKKWARDWDEVKFCSQRCRCLGTK